MGNPRTAANHSIPGKAEKAANNRLATVNDAVAATGKTSTLPGNKCITVDEMNAMIGSGGDREIPIDPLYNLMESGVSLLVLDYTNSGSPIGMINLECQGYSDSYDLQNTGTAVCLNVGSRGDIIMTNQFNVSFESGDITLRYMGIANQDGNESESEYYYVDSGVGGIYTMNHNYFHILVVAERNS